jgi:ATP-binding cassette subfamily B protein
MTHVALPALLWVVNLASMLVAMLSMLIPGMAVKKFFDLLSGNAPAGIGPGHGLWTIIALLFVAEFGRSLGLFGLIKSNVPFFVHTLALLRKNMLCNILNRPGARALPDSPGEATSRFGGDAFEISLFALWVNDFIGLLLLAIGAIIFMVLINAKITLIVLLPFVFVVLIAHLANDRIEYYRRAARKWKAHRPGLWN